MDEIRELLGRLGQLTQEELDNLRQLVVAKFKELDTDEASVDDTAILVELAEISDQIMAEGQAREAKAEEARQQREAARERINAISGEAEGEEEAETSEEDETEGKSEEGKDEPAEEPESESEEQGAEENAPEPVAAGGAVQKMAARQGKVSTSPEATIARNKGTLTASAGFQAGRAIEDRLDLANEMVRVLDTLNRDAPYGKVIVASSRFEYPEERQLGGDVWDNERKIREVKRVDPSTGALVATGGICQPVNVDYAVPTWATAETPITDGLASFEATRGGVRYVKPPDVAEWEGATGVWTEATDAEPGSSTKPVKSLVCGEEITVFVEAVSTRIGFGNMQSRFAPEQVAANTDLAMAAAARVRENNLLALIAEKSVEDVTFAKGLGATRDFLTVLHSTVEMYRSVHRLPDSQALTAIFPRWLRGLIKTDIAREIGTAKTPTFDQLRIPDSYVEDMIRDAGVNPIFHLDGQASTAKFPNQFFATDVKEATYKKFPEKMTWYFFAEDMVQRLDAGRLDLGVVRDSTLDATNDYETFVEVFESIANRGFTNGILQLVTELCASGGTSGTVSAACP